ncbi:hypothetical protein [Nonomuraea sp. NPDC002799]
MNELEQEPWTSTKVGAAADAGLGLEGLAERDDTWIRPFAWRRGDHA